MKDATLKFYKVAPHGLATTMTDKLNADLLDFIQPAAQYLSKPSEERPPTH